MKTSNKNNSSYTQKNKTINNKKCRSDQAFRITSGESFFILKFQESTMSYKRFHRRLISEYFGDTSITFNHKTLNECIIYV